MQQQAHDSHDEGTYLQPLPDCLAPTASERADADYTLPSAGDPVVLQDGCVIFLPRTGGPATRDERGAWVCAAPMRGFDHCGGTDWAATHPLDPDHSGLDQGDAEAIRAAWRLLAAVRPAAD